jgi:hypothetical protein
MIIEQTVDIPASHRLFIEVPREVPVGRAILTFTPEGDTAIVRDITPEETRLLAKRVIEEHRPAFIELAK